MSKTRWITNIVEIVLGAVLVICGGTGLIDEYWSSMGVALVFVGALQMIRVIRYKSNPAYREEYDVAVHDERNSFLRIKAWSWAGYMFVMITAVGSIVFKLLGREDLMMFCSSSVCLVLVLYWLSWLVLKKKY